MRKKRNNKNTKTSQSTAPRRKLTPAQQPKKRYLHLTLVELTPSGGFIQKTSTDNSRALTPSEIQRGLNISFERLHGELTASKTHLKIIEHEFDQDTSTHTIILRTTSETLQETRQMISLLTWIGDRHNTSHPVIPNLHSISGVLKSLRNRITKVKETMKNRIQT